MGTELYFIQNDLVSTKIDTLKSFVVYAGW